MGKLIYFPLYGRAEHVRMLLNHAGVKFEEENISMADWPTRKAEFPSGQLPIWIDDDGCSLNQSIAILNALARQHGYSPVGFHGEWANTWVSETIADYGSKGFVSNLFKPEVSEETVKAWTVEHIKLNKTFEDHLAKKATKFLAGDKPTASDFHLFSFVTAIPLNEVKKHANVSDALAATHGTDATPLLNAWVETMKEELKDYLANRPKCFL